MRFRQTYDFAYASAILIRVFTDPAYYRRKYAMLGGRSEIGEARDHGDQFAIDIRHALDTSQASIPQAVRGWIGDSVMLAQTDTWHRSQARGQTAMTVEKAPASATLAMQLVDTDTGSTLTLDFEFRVAIPLIGGRIEKAIADPMTRHVERDLAITNTIAADYAGGS